LQGFGVLAGGQGQAEQRRRSKADPGIFACHTFFLVSQNLNYKREQTIAG
jgi:hypothetical protein